MTAPRPRTAADVIELRPALERSESAVAAVAAAPVRHVPAALLEALLGSWGTPEELGVAPAPERHLRLVAG